MKKLALVYTDLCLGGIQRKIIDILNYIDVHTIPLDPQVILRWETEFTLLPNLNKPHKKIYIPSRYLPFSRRRLSFLLNILYHLLKEPPDVILTHVFGSSIRTIPLVKLLWGNKVKVVISQDNIFSYENPEWYARKLVPWIYSMADAIIVQTEISKKDLVDHWKIQADKVKVIPNWARNLAAPTDKKRPIDLMYCGRFEDQKNLLQLLEICRHVILKNPSFCVKLIGNGRQEQLLRDFVSRHHLEKNIQFIEPINDVEKYMYQSKIFALTSKFEGQPMTLLEAMSCGCIPICLDYPGVHEYIDSGVNGYIVKSEQAMAEKILQVLDTYKPNDELQRLARQTVYDRYSEKNIQRYIDLLLE